MGLFDFFKKKNKGIDNLEFYSVQFQQNVCALALWKLEENNLDPAAAISELKKIGLNDEQVDYVLTESKKYLQVRAGLKPQPTGLQDMPVNDEILAFAHNAYFQYDHSYEVAEQKLLEKGLNQFQVADVIARLKIANANMVNDFKQQLDSGAISSIKVTPNPEHTKGNVSEDQVDKYIGYGAFQMERGDLENALELFDKALELDDRATLAYANKGTLYSKKGDNSKALEFYDKALAIEPNNIQVLENKMFTQLEMLDELDESEFIGTAKKILDIDPDNANALIYIVQFQSKENDLDNALKSMRRLFVNQYKEQVVIQLLLDLFHKLPIERAIKEFEALNIGLSDEGKYQLAYCKGLYFKGMGMYDEAIENFKQLNLLQEFSWNYYQMAIMKNLQEKTEDALELLKTTFRLEPGLKEDAKQFPELQNLWTNPVFIVITQ